MANTIFDWKENKRKNSRYNPRSSEGYGNEHHLICQRCFMKVYTADWGNPSGYGYVIRWAQQIAKEHLEFCLR